MSGGGGGPRPAYPRSFPSQLCQDLLSIPASTSVSCGACGLFGDQGSWYRLKAGCVAGSSAPPRFVLPSFPTGFSFPDRSAFSTQSRWSESRGGGPLGEGFGRERGGVGLGAGGVTALAPSLPRCSPVPFLGPQSGGRAGPWQRLVATALQLLIDVPALICRCQG
ncbi:hypothetical protein CBR_g56702 [Chara braunii]|uniref:Uncharacterized protein n=1 Tax=Chara braunii TaxID=69332 RepID=A0A388MDW1_CHABU|nr:hypothetical protein CBR_g56702 [Chara braunii]|eukprot:GBG92672.1 hypothetical protein CBR_g56702 [Chara braunii]